MQTPMAAGSVAQWAGVASCFAHSGPMMESSIERSRIRIGMWTT